MMTYDEYREAVAGADLNYVMLFDTDEHRTRFLEAIRDGGEAIRIIDELMRRIEGGTTGKIERCG